MVMDMDMSVLVNAAVSSSSSLALVGGDRHNTDKIINLSLDNLYSIQENMSRGDMVATINVSMLEIKPVLKHTWIQNIKSKNKLKNI